MGLSKKHALGQDVPHRAVSELRGACLLFYLYTIVPAGSRTWLPGGVPKRVPRHPIFEGRRHRVTRGSSSKKRWSRILTKLGPHLSLTITQSPYWGVMRNPTWPSPMRWGAEAPGSVWSLWLLSGHTGMKEWSLNAGMSGIWKRQLERSWGWAGNLGPSQILAVGDNQRLVPKHPVLHLSLRRRWGGRPPFWMLTVAAGFSPRCTPLGS